MAGKVVHLLILVVVFSNTILAKTRRRSKIFAMEDVMGNTKTESTTEKEKEVIKRRTLTTPGIEGIDGETDAVSTKSNISTTELTTSVKIGKEKRKKPPTTEVSKTTGADKNRKHKKKKSSKNTKLIREEPASTTSTSMPTTSTSIPTTSTSLPTTSTSMPTTSTSMPTTSTSMPTTSTSMPITTSSSTTEADDSSPALEETINSKNKKSRKKKKNPKKNSGRSFLSQFLSIPDANFLSSSSGMMNLHLGGLFRNENSKKNETPIIASISKRDLIRALEGVEN